MTRLKSTGTNKRQVQTIRITYGRKQSRKQRRQDRPFRVKQETLETGVDANLTQNKKDKTKMAAMAAPDHDSSSPK